MSAAQIYVSSYTFVLQQTQMSKTHDTYRPFFNKKFNQSRGQLSSGNVSIKNNQIKLQAKIYYRPTQ